jgi:hypothetical protein
MAGGIAGGGVVIGVLALTGIVQPGVHVFAAQALFLAGALAGLMHGIYLNIFGRPAGLSPAGACSRTLVAGIFCIPALVAAWVITAGMTLSAALMTSWRLSWLLVAAVSWVAGLALCGWAALEGVRALKRVRSQLAQVLGRGAILAILAVASLGGALLWPPPGAIQFKPWLSPVGVVLMGIGAGLWIGLPLVCTLQTVSRRLGLGAGTVRSGPAPSEAG